MTDPDPLWYKDAIIYQAHVKSFFDSNNDGVGDFQGLTGKLDYLQGLGITCLWLLPFFPSPLRDDGYDISDYTSVHPSYGTIDDFKTFVDAAHARDIRILIELVVNHTSDQHPWFQRARLAPAGSPEREFYVWSDSDKTFPDTRIIFTDSEKSNWTFDPAAQQYYWHRFFSHQPDLNHNNPAVVDAVIDVMKFWLDLGVDALRLDAVPYLCVREGTTNENLPETHAVLKRIRRELDAAYANRMLLAEANLWPDEVSDYFGNGDECHMAFHFPLMPRMFMALRQEDRHAITEILNQTPDIPETCQWALFLRNHDELTLEMVTSEERDYMYQVYAADPKMLVNGGIRRRLAPLVENSRRRVELLNALLFSMPGTPIVYYGDELGMGDNIYLGDRNGVRTPMQWTSDRNGGFSRADTARLVAPPIVDPVYGYQAINVEAQERYPFSLLNWTKRLIAIRRQHRVFGRGALAFVPCRNRKVLAYVRRDAQETVLVVANLSRSLQPAELDLSEFSGLTPIDVFGLAELPRIGDAPYFLTLGSYAAYWFSLVTQPMQLTQTVADWGEVAAPLAEDLPSLLVGTNWETMLGSAMRTVVERQVLVPYLQRQRWYRSRTRAIRDARIVDVVLLRGGSNPAFLAIASVNYTDGWTESYVLPLAFLSDEAADSAIADAPHAVIARITGARKGVIVDGLLDDDVCNRLMASVDDQRRLPGTKGTVSGARVAGVEAGGPRVWTRIDDEHSNSLVFVDNRYVLKLFRRIEPGLNPEFEIGRVLTSEGFTRVPALAGALLYERSGLEPGTLAVVQAAVPNQGSGWSFTLDELHRYYERVAARIGAEGMATDAAPEGSEPPPFFAALEGWYLTAASTLGRRTAELHLALAHASEPGFAPEPLDEAALRDLAAAAAAHTNDVLDRLADRLVVLDDATRSSAELVLEMRSALVERVTAVAGVHGGGLRTRVHGAYHLGQVLRTEEDFVILDFEGEAGRTLAERRAKTSPLKDVAGALRSFHYAAQVALIASARSSPATVDQLAPWAETWQHWVSRAFLTTYRETMAVDSTILPSGDAFETLLRAFVLDKALDELGYELNNRPEWARIPLHAIATLALPLQR